MVRHICEFCGGWTPFVPSWFEPEREVGEPLLVKEWNEDLYEALLKFRTVEMEGRIYHWPSLKSKMIQRYTFAVLEAKRGQRIKYDAKDKPWGSRLQTKLTPLLKEVV